MESYGGRLLMESIKEKEMRREGEDRREEIKIRKGEMKRRKRNQGRR